VLRADVVGKTWDQMVAELPELCSSPVDWIAVDTVDRVQSMADKYVLSTEAKDATIATACGGYGKGIEKSVKLVSLLYDTLKSSGKNIILIAHAGRQVDPAPGGERHVWGPNLHQKLGSYLTQDATDVLFACDVVNATGAPIKTVYTQHTSWCMAKSWRSLPHTIPFEWDAIVDIPTPAELEAARKAIAALEPERQEKAQRWLATAGRAEIKSVLKIGV
jgi:hypothetical protein